ncbi:hypothetical protein [Hymenobacter terricola]|uniref:hypothetical protein n=1 Tax=Hymenobacter terricola TaxID=2819236 RepID=UPI001B30C53C|nr:hypothetical protein [Hymenobacter terricola]
MADPAAVVGGRWCNLAAQMPTEFVRLALGQALALRPPAPGLLIHADRGSRHPRAACRAHIDQAGAVPGCGRPGNPCDNAPAEAGGSALKTELRPGGSPFASLEEARLEGAHHLDTCFNLNRRRSALGDRSPHQFEHGLKPTLPQRTVRFHWTISG